MCLVFACCHSREFALAREKSGRVAPCPGQLGSGFAMRDALASLQKRTDKSVKKKKKKRAERGERQEPADRCGSHQDGAVCFNRSQFGALCLEVELAR